MTQGHAGLAALEDEMLQREARQPLDHLGRDLGRRAEEPAVLHEGFREIERIVAGERLALAGRGIDVGLAGALGRVLHAIDMIDVGLVPLDRVGRRIADKHLAHQRMRQRSGVLPLGLVVERLDLPRQVLQLDQRRHDQPGAIAHGAGARRGRGGADPERQRAGLDRRRPQQAAFHVVDAPLVVEALATPGETQDVERLLEGSGARLVVPAEALELGRPIALSQPDLDAAAGNVVDHRQVLGQPQRMAVQRRQRHALADAAVGSGDREGGTGDDGRGAVAVGLAVMLAGPDRVEAQPIGLARELQALAIGGVPGLAQAGIGLEAERQAELDGHDQPPSWRLSSVQRSMIGISLSSFSAGRVKVTRSTPISWQNFS